MNEDDLALIEAAFGASADPACEAWRRLPRVIPPARRAGTPFAGWCDHEIVSFLVYIETRVGRTRMLAILGITGTTARSWLLRGEAPRCRHAEMAARRLERARRQVVVPMAPIPLRRQVACESCGATIDSEAPGTFWQIRGGWVERFRTGGGPHGITDPVWGVVVRCATCLNHVRHHRHPGQGTIL